MVIRFSTSLSFHSQQHHQQRGEQRHDGQRRGGQHIEPGAENCEVNGVVPH